MPARFISCSSDGARLPRPWWGLCVFALVLAFLLAVPAHSQSLGEIARQERERKAKQQAADVHVYTNADLERPRILVPEDQERAAKRKDPPLPPAMPAQPAAIDPNSDQTTASNLAPAPPVDLGEIAREERRRKAAQHAMAHVYTNDDMGRKRILVPEDARRVEEASKQSAPRPASAAPETARTDSNADSVPLGDVARRYRALEALHPGAKPAGAPAQNYPFPRGNAIFAAPHFAPRAAASSPAPARPRTASRRGESRSVSGLPASESRVEESRPVAAAPQVAEAAEDADGSVVRVRPGDSLWRLAQRHLGRGKDWKRIAALNPQLKNPDRLLVGTLIRLPE